MAFINNCGATRPLSMTDFFAILKNQMEDRVLKNKLGFIEQEEKRLLRRYRSETRILKIKQEQRLGNRSLKRHDTKVTNIKGSPGPQSSEGKAWFTYDKRQSSKSIYVCETCPESKNTTFSTDGEPAQTTKRFPRLSSLEKVKIQEPISPTSKGTCQSSISQKEDDFLSPDIKSNEASMYFLTEVQTKRSSSPRIRRKTWNGKTLPTLQLADPSNQRLRSFSQEDKGLSNVFDVQVHIKHQKSEIASEVDLKTTKMKPNGFSKTAFPTAEDIQCRKFLSAPNFSIRKSRSMNSLKSADSLPPFFKNENSTSVTKNSEEDLYKEVTDTCPLPDKETNIFWKSPVCHSGPVCLSQQRLKPLSKQVCVVEGTSSNSEASILSENSIELPRASESGTGAVRKVAEKKQTSRTQNGKERGQETTLLKNASVKREKFTSRWSSLTCQQEHGPKEDMPRMKITKKQDSLGSKTKQPSLETEEDDPPESFDKSKWQKALKKVFNINMFLSGMVALQKQREVDRLAIEQKQAELEKLYKELKYCRYLRLPSHEEGDEHNDSVAWVFGKK